MKLIKDINYEHLRPLVNLKKISLIILSVLILSISSSGAATKEEKKKDCLYCEKYEKMSDWPESERPKEFIYEEVVYPNEMFGKYDKINSKNRKAAAGKKVYKTFVKQKGSLNKKQHEMVQNMAYFEALYNETLNDPKATVESVEGLKKGREAMRMSLKISPKASTSEAVLKFWATGKMLTKAYKLNKKKKKKVQKQVVDPDIAERAAVLASLKKQIATAKVNAQRAATIEAQKKIGEAE